jgi:hypothetical protein
MAIDLLSGKQVKGNFARSSSMGAYYFPSQRALAPQVTVIRQSWWPGLIPLAIGAWVVTKIVKHTK